MARCYAPPPPQVHRIHKKMGYTRYTLICAALPTPLNFARGNCHHLPYRQNFPNKLSQPEIFPLTACSSKHVFRLG